MLTLWFAFILANAVWQAYIIRVQKRSPNHKSWFWIRLNVWIALSFLTRGDPATHLVFGAFTFQFFWQTLINLMLGNKLYYLSDKGIDKIIKDHMPEQVFYFFMGLLFVGGVGIYYMGYV